MIKAAMVGAGFAAQNFARQLAEQRDIRLAAVADINLSQAAAFCKLRGGRPYANVGQMIATERPDLLIVASANHAHAENVLEAVDAGISNIYCEKPLAIDLDDAIRMTEATERAQVRTGMGFTLPYIPGVRALLKLVASGELGDVLNAHVQLFRGFGFWGHERTSYRGTRGHHAAVAHPELSGGWTLHHACHQVFLLSRLSGRVRSVFGKVLSSDSACPSEELINATLVFENDAVGTLCDSIGSFRGLRVGVIGTRGTAILEDTHLKQEGETSELRVHLEGREEEIRQAVIYGPHNPTPLGDLIRAIREDGPSPVSFREGLVNMMVCQAILESNRNGQVVEVEPLPVTVQR